MAILTGLSVGARVNKAWIGAIVVGGTVDGWVGRRSRGESKV